MLYRTPPGQGARRQVVDRSKLRFAFTTQQQAEAFKAQFGGVLHEVPRREVIFCVVGSDQHYAHLGHERLSAEMDGISLSRLASRYIGAGTG